MGKPKREHYVQSNTHTKSTKDGRSKSASQQGAMPGLSFFMHLHAMSHEASHCCRGAVRSSTRRCKAATARLWTSAAAMPTLHAAALALALIGVQQVAAQSYCASSDCGTQQKPKIPDTTFYCGNGASGTVPAASSPSTDDVDYCADSSACPCGRCCFCECEVAAGWTSAGGWVSPSGIECGGAVCTEAECCDALQCTEPEDADCFEEFLHARAPGNPIPECNGPEATDETPRSGSWCLCMASVGAVGVSSDEDQFLGWLGDGVCDRVLDTAACHHDGGDCTISVSTAIVAMILLYTTPS